MARPATRRSQLTYQRHALAAVLGACSLALAGCGKHPAQAGPARRAILITCDTLRADRLGVYGYPLATSPALDAFGAEATVFEEAYSTAPWTKPALAALLTGRTPDEIGMAGGNLCELDRRATTLAELARDAGYHTAAFVSNWMLRRPTGALRAGGVAQGFELFDDEMPAREANRKTFERDASATTSAALSWLEERQIDGDDQFFLWVHYQDPHGPYTAARDELKRFERPASGEALPPLGHTEKGRGQIPSYQALDGVSEPEEYRARYDAEIAAFDREAGRLLDWLHANRWLDDALVVFTADHGESLGEHGYWFCHGETLNREVVRVPLIVRFPASAGRLPGRVRAVASHLDLWPTFIEALRLPAQTARGLSLFDVELPAARGVGQCFRALGDAERWVAISDGRWRLVREGALAPRLYDIQRDPGEQRDLAEQEPRRAGELAAELELWLQPPGTTIAPRQTPARDLDTEALRALGYTGDSK